MSKEGGIISEQRSLSSSAMKRRMMRGEYQKWQPSLPIAPPPIHVYLSKVMTASVTRHPRHSNNFPDNFFQTKCPQSTKIRLYSLRASHHQAQRLYEMLMMRRDVTIETVPGKLA